MNEPRSPRRVFQRIGALLAGILANIIPAIATDMSLAAAGIFPPLSEPGNFTTPLCLLATAYRSVYGIAGGYITALLAPDHPMGHALTLGALGMAACIAGAVGMWGIGPAWYPVALVALAMPYAWAGGRLRVMQLSRGHK
jgi:hypothetical protein